ncbi:preprotein translocase subunit YajC [Rickettsia endosymbiont of Cardiosporidium cionae]|uniref:preprotein translocase subunit YajC n=1 Tax=Rickettsia endosymbiont of Cardiosporidium cionae TaxID=2777155 RepID=UPI0018931336|nr:preprotein translocase subunit YajC [Rickettsia endosymbiont of Cardiosporidium cionae]KAF8818782.1 hypothetical protein IHI24_000016 [Rickettsia endosymbiont of Cardiosporidium cionae]
MDKIINTIYAEDTIPLETVNETTAAITETASSVGSSTTTGGILSNIGQFVPMILIVLVFYFFLIVPQNKRKKQQEAMIKNLKKGEEVLTSSGLFGSISKINDIDDFVFIEISKDVEIKILKSNILSVVNKNNSSTPVTEKKNKKN